MSARHKPPAYRHFNARNLAVVRIDGRDHYLGRYGSEESHERYARLIAEWRAGAGNRSGHAAGGEPGIDRTLNEILWAHWEVTDVPC